MKQDKQNNRLTLSHHFRQRLYSYIIIASVLIGSIITTVYTHCFLGQLADASRGYAITMVPQMLQFLGEEDPAVASAMINEELTSLKDIPFVSYASLLNNQQKIITEWSRNQSDRRIDTSLQVPVDSFTVSKRMVYIKHTFATRDGHRYYLQIISDASLLSKKIIQYIVPLYLLSAIGIVFGMFMLAKYFDHVLFIPIAKLNETTEQIMREGDLTISFPTNNKFELGLLAGNISKIIGQLKDLLNNMRGTVLNFTDIISDLTNAGQNIINNAHTIREHTGSTTFMMDQLTNSFNDVSESLQKLNAQSDRSSTTVCEMEQVNRMVVGNIEQLTSSVNLASNAINQINNSITDNAKHLEQLHQDINGVTDAMKRLDESISNEEKEAKQSLSTTKQLSKNANNGLIAMDNTNQGLRKIKESFNTAANSVQTLGSHINDIGAILHVIEDVTKQTNLLALNAAIIAAQSGESGRSFAVVSNEIAALADRTKASTKEIAELIITIQEKTNLAVSAIASSQVIIDAGTKLGADAAEAYNNLKASADLSADQAQHIAYATIEQAEELRAITDTMENIANTVNVINNFTQNQAQDAAAMVKAANDMRSISQQVANSSSEQERSSKEVLNAIQIITAMSSEVSSKQKEQNSHTGNAVESVSSIDNNANKQEQAAQQLDDIIFAINQQSQQLTSYIKAYKV